MAVRVCAPRLRVEAKFLMYEKAVEETFISLRLGSLSPKATRRNNGLEIEATVSCLY
jgi:hypothetical protein